MESSSESCHGNHLRQKLTNMKTVIIFHSADFDGIFSGKIAEQYYGTKPTEIQMIGWDFSDPVPNVSPDDVLVMVDISIPALMTHPRLIWIDHHKTSIEAYPDTINGYRIEGVAACRLAYQYFDDRVQLLKHKLPMKSTYINRAVSEPWAVRLAGEYDVFDHRDKDANSFQFGLRSANLEPHWETLLEPRENAATNKLIESLLIVGRKIELYMDKENASIIKSIGFDLQWEGRLFLACNAARYNSQMFEAGIRPDHEGLLGFKWKGDIWSVSLYRVPFDTKSDLSVISKNYGGGGHPGASGFVCKELPFFYQPNVNTIPNHEIKPTK